MKSNVPHLYDLYLVLWCLPRLENEEAVSTLKESTKVLTQHLEEVGTAAFGSARCPLTSCLTTRILLLFPSHLLKTLPQLVDSLPFASDERSRSFHQVYRGTFPAVQPSSWCILFRCTSHPPHHANTHLLPSHREAFHMPEDQVLVPHLQCSLNTSLLRVIDNDTGIGVPSVFHCIQPHLYPKNKVRGITLPPSPPPHLGYVLPAEWLHFHGRGMDPGEAI